MRILFIGDIFGRPGRNAIDSHLRQIKSQYNVDFCIANSENAAAGKGITHDVARQLLNAGADVLTLGNHAWDNKDVFSFIHDERRLVRAYNYAPGLPGYGYATIETPGGITITVSQLLGRLFMKNVDCPFRKADELVDAVKDSDIIIIDIHAEATSEKVSMGWYLDGRVSAVIGTHTHIPTADERILPKGTAYITDVGMTGPYDSVIGMDIDVATQQLITTLKKPFKIAQHNVKIAGVLFDVNETTGKAKSIERILIPLAEPNSYPKHE
ncbi:MAG: TIGR00282 family metallophosphoesterase [Candidatus Omnitrophota bacterium]|jgi:metallophosphoesterase (TIGR00282 family)|nr:MAG: TIGR00282 family metallophosphoesterase [Candidatus Omnitrophota bacterium]